VRVEVYPGREAVVEFDPGLTFECVDGCTWCCHRGVFLSGDEFDRLAAHADAATTVDGRTKVRREDKARDEHVDVDGAACYFLTDEGLCALQDEHDWKPATCSLFPLEASLEAGALHVDVRADAERNCEGLGVSERRVVDHLDAFLPELLWELAAED
jgi:hypothetical protein